MLIYFIYLLLFTDIQCYNYKKINNFPFRHFTESNRNKIQIIVKSRDCSRSDGPTMDKKDLNCLKMMEANINLSNLGNFNTAEQVIVIDRIYDSSSKKQVPLLYPYVIVLKQEPVMQFYNMKYKNDVNGEAKEEIINKRNPGFIGCDDTSDTPTCGKMLKNGHYVPYSQGFCCSCDENVNKKRQPQKISKDDIMSFKALYRSLNSEFNNTRDGRRKRSLSYVPVSNAYHKIRTERQIRGGQNCMDKRTPIYAEPNKYHDSAHCLRYSDIWYSIHELSKPILSHSVSLKIYQKRQTENGPYWLDLTYNQIPNVGSLNRNHLGNAKNFFVKYGYSKHELNFNLDSKNYNVLTPATLSNHYPEITQKPDEFLVVNKRKINTNGTHCDKIGVGHVAFYHQPQRCNSRAGSCLKNQPLEMWRQDKISDMTNRKGKYFLKNFAQVPKDALHPNYDGDTILKLKYDKPHRNWLKVGTNDEKNAIINDEYKAKITEVYSDSTDESNTVITVKVYNSALICGSFRVKINDCPLKMSSNWNKCTKLKEINPQQIAVYSININEKIQLKEFYCSVTAVDVNNKVVAIKKVKIVKNDVCVCMWYCQCTCVKKGLKCVKLPNNVYKAAGFNAPIPVESEHITMGHQDVINIGVLTFIMMLIMTLFLLGLTKGIIGLFCSKRIGLLGFDILIGLPKKMYSYYEEELQNIPVVYDSEGWPVHPQTYERVQNISTMLEFCLNMTFFFTFPITLSYLIVTNSCYLSPYYENADGRKRTKDDSSNICADCYFYEKKSTATTDTDDNEYGNFSFESYSGSSKSSRRN